MNNLFYKNFGQLTCAFSSMEGNLRELISGIAFSGKNSIASAFMDNSFLSKNIGILKKLSRLHWNSDDKFTLIIRELNDIKDVRNLFIHGVWHPNNYGEPDGYAIVTDFKTKYTNTDSKKVWDHGLVSHHSATDFNIIFNKVVSISTKIETLCVYLEEVEEYEFGVFGRTTELKPEEYSLTSEGIST